MKKYHVFKINLTIVNILPLFILIVCLLFTWLLFPKYFFDMFELFKSTKFCALMLPVFILYFSLHEILHAIGYIIHGADPKKLTFGAEIEKGVLYCLCKDDISKKNILFALMYPFFFIGVVTYIISIVFNYPLLLLLSIANIAGAAGDLVYFCFIVKLDKGVIYSEMDDGTSFALKGKEDYSKYGHFGLDYVGTVDNISRKDFKRIKVSKLSMIIFIICIVFLIVGLFI